MVRRQAAAASRAVTTARRGTTPARRSRWWFAAALIPPLVAVVTALVAPQPHGHWLEHLSTATLKMAQLVVLIVLASLLGRRTMGVLLLACGAVAVVGIVVQVVGDLQVAQSIWRTSGNPGFGSGYAQGHERSEVGDLLVAIGGFATAIEAGVRRWVSVPLAIAAAVLVAIPPPYFWPAAGILLLLLYRLTSCGEGRA
jgi:hypothetical protein